MTDRPVNPSTAAAVLIVDELARGGITDCVVAPGSRSTALALALHHDRRINVWTQLDERSAGFVALGYARVTGRAMPIVVTSGSAVAQLHPAVIEADASGVPLLVISADRPYELRDTGANQTIRQAALFGVATRYATHVEVLTDLPSTNRYVRSVMQRVLTACHGAASRPGPVQLNVAFREPTVPVADDGRAAASDVWQTALDGRAGDAPWVAVSTALNEPDPAIITDLARLCAGARGVILAGALDRVDDETALLDAANQLAARLNWPVLADAASVLRRSNAAVAHLAHVVTHPAVTADITVDVVLRVGRTGITPGVDAFLRPATTDVLIDPYASMFDPDRHVTHRVVAHPTRFFVALHRELQHGLLPAADGFAEQFQNVAAAIAMAHTAVLSDEPQLTEPATMRVLADLLTADDLLVVGASMPIRDFDTYAPHGVSVPVLANRGASGIDGFASTVCGAAIARQRFTVGVCGDVTFLHDINGLLTGTDTPVALVVLDNDGGAIFSFLPQAAYPDALRDVFTMPHGRDVTAIAAGYGANTVTVTTDAELRDALHRARQQPGVTVIRVPSDRERNVSLHAALRDAARQVQAG